MVRHTWPARTDGVVAHVAEQAPARARILRDQPRDVVGARDAKCRVRRVELQTSGASMGVSG